MKVYLKNCRGEQTIRNLTLRQYIRIRVYQWAHVPKEQRCFMKILF